MYFQVLTHQNLKCGAYFLNMFMVLAKHKLQFLKSLVDLDNGG